jgi:hypothetical protein
MPTGLRTGSPVGEAASMQRARVVAVDVGSVRSNFAWAALDLPDREPVGVGGADPEGAAVAVLDALHAGLRVALGFEAPLMVPVPSVAADGWRDPDGTVGKRRRGRPARAVAATKHLWCGRRRIIRTDNRVREREPPERVAAFWFTPLNEGSRTCTDANGATS